MKIIVDIKTCNDCRYKSHTGNFTTGGAKPCCNHPETCKLLGHDCFKRVIPYRTVHDDNIHRVYREPKSIPKWCPLRKNQITKQDPTNTEINMWLETILYKSLRKADIIKMALRHFKL